MSARFFRGLILAHLMALCVFSILAAFDHGVSQALLDAYLQSGPSWLMGESTLAILLVLAAVAVLIVGYVGLWLFKSWSRTLCLSTTFLGCVLTAMLGPSLYGGLSAAFYDASTLLWGAVLTSAYTSPIAHRFRSASAPDIRSIQDH